jgi:cytochrome c heme-lyase
MNLRSLEMESGQGHPIGDFPSQRLAAPLKNVMHESINLLILDLSTRSQYNTMAKETETPAEACPVDPATRAAWLKSNSSRPTFPGAAAVAGQEFNSKTIDQTPPPSPKTGFLSRFISSKQDPEVPKDLGVDRVISTIPRASAVDAPGTPANSEKESGVSDGGNWIYPSEKMFFEAMKRKGHSGDAADMKTIVPIHNAVNERAWKEIKEWERPWGSEEKYGFTTWYILGNVSC